MTISKVIGNQSSRFPAMLSYYLNNCYLSVVFLFFCCSV